MIKIFKSIAITIFLIPLIASSLFAELSVKIRELTTVDGLKENQLYGYGLVIGLAGTGDSKFAFTGTTLENFIRNLGIEPEHFKSKNVAAVLITSNLYPFVRAGDKIDVTVSSIGDAKSLDGGVLVQSPLMGADGNIYAVAQGSLEFPDTGIRRPRSVQGTQQLSSGRRRVVKTSARISDGGIVERNLSPNIIVRDENLDKDWIFLVINDWDYGTADRIIKAVAGKYPESEPAITQSGKIQLTLLKEVPLQEFIDGVQQLEIVPPDRPRVVINERDGTIVAGGNVQVADALVSREGLIVEIRETDEQAAASLINESTTVKDLVDALNAVGAGTGDIISIMKALKSAGAIHAELIIQ